MEVRIQTRNEELANGISHALGVLFCLIGMPFLLMKSSGQHNLITESSVIVFGIGMLLVYSFSSLYHLAQKEKTKQLLKIADHISIYYLIAGTYSPLMVIYLNKETALVFLGIMWSIVLLGTFFKIFYVDRFKFLSVLFYLLMGWMIVFVIKPLWGVIPLSIFLWILAGGLSYTVGVYFYVKGHKNYFHTVWHFFVLLGTVFHYVAILESL
ncbi:channel protein (hemolysin III family) [Flavobacterium sp. 103]|jgi:hemolysin III|uniref:Hemolysin III family protein n=2 Tax=Flavobacterium TaxID=237 RepID=A0A2W7TQ20_9FLAO|nr:MULTISPECIES: hemolysin III family protein [Flavobacterium]MBW4362334.1 hemolysin III family protein [Flavobacterium taihuense]PVX45035.1 channel protein (hemolysin III family) [Flavobacterium sp. 103]PZX92158.1 hemolysin III family protein [Flavobacterium aquariorum]